VQISIIDAPEKRRFRPSGLQTIEDADDKVLCLLCAVMRLNIGIEEVLI
jgi:hypothetical protein